MHRDVFTVVVCFRNDPKTTQHDRSRGAAVSGSKETTTDTGSALSAVKSLVKLLDLVKIAVPVLTPFKPLSL